VSAPTAHVIGAGIAGLSAALALSKQGWQVSVREKADGASESGAGIQLGPNATRVLIDLGLGPDLERIAFAPVPLCVRRFSDGAVLARTDFSTLTERLQAPYLTLRRADLHQMLLKAAQASGVTVSFGQPFQSLAELSRADLLIGADGLHSSVRAALFPGKQPRFTGYEAWRAMVPLADPASRDVTLWLGSGKHCVTYPVGPAGQGQFNIVFVRRATTERNGWQNAVSTGEEHSFFRDAAGALRDSVLPAVDWRVWSLFDMAPVAATAGNIVLIGDAAHPVLPFLAQGAGLAIEDAGVLGQLAALRKGMPGPDALNAFAQSRRRRAARLQQAAAQNGKLYHLAGPLGFARDLAIRAMSGKALLSRYDWLYDFESGPAAKALIDRS
jgi:salicylate hydroxylase